MSSFDCSVDRIDHLTVISPVGGLDAFSARSLRRVIDVLPEPTTAGVVVDLSEVDFIDSAGVGVLVGLARRTRERGLVMAMAVPRKTTKALLETVGFDRIAVITDSPQEAMVAASGPRVPAYAPAGYSNGAGDRN